MVSERQARGLRRQVVTFGIGAVFATVLFVVTAVGAIAGLLTGPGGTRPGRVVAVDDSLRVARLTVVLDDGATVTPTVDGWSTPHLGDRVDVVPGADGGSVETETWPFVLLTGGVAAVLWLFFLVMRDYRRRELGLPPSRRA
ncbi:MAG: hypothetical protein U0Q15_19145 [Kineosporiaceae bacterium]